MKALVTGASSGIGRDIALYLSSLGYDIIAVARSMEELEKLKQEIQTNVMIYPLDLSVEDNCKLLYEKTKPEEIDILVNNAGFGAFGEFVQLDLDRELDMVNTNIKALHILTKLYLKDMKQKDKGHILNVASIAGFLPGPLMATYYGTKAYVLRLSQSIQKELKKSKSKVKLSVLCPGPVDTNFNNTAGVRFSIGPLTSQYVAKYAVDKMLKGKEIIVPGMGIKWMRIGCKFAPDKLLASISYHVQTNKK